MSGEEEKEKQQIKERTAKVINPAKYVKAPELSIKHEFSLEEKANKK